MGMMLEHVGETEAARGVEAAVVRLLNSGRIPSVGTDSGLATDAIGDMVAAEILG